MADENERAVFISQRVGKLFSNRLSCSERSSLWRWLHRVPFKSADLRLEMISPAAWQLSAQAASTTREVFLKDEVLKRAFVRSVEVIGEAAKKVPEEIRLQLPELEWRKMTGMRDRLIHN